ncbi:MAG: protein DA1 [Chloroflexi bacterium]|nr:MAG: protein DA1 [Chloroflexota bacterium]
MVAPKQQERGAETVRCPICRADAVETMEEAKPLYSRVVHWLNSEGLTYNNLPLKLELCNRAKLAQLLHERHGSHSLGVTTSTTYAQDGRIVRTEVSGVAILHGLPKILFQGVTLHELGHVWLIVHDILDLPTWGEEGFCELLSYRYYQHLNTPEANYYASSIEKNPNSVYSDGFRRLHALTEKYGFPRLLTILNTTKQLPR